MRFLEKSAQDGPAYRPADLEATRGHRRLWQQAAASFGDHGRAALSLLGMCWDNHRQTALEPTLKADPIATPSGKKHARPGGGIPPSGLAVRGVGTTNLLHTHQKGKRTGPAILDASRSNDQPSRACFAATVAPCGGRGPRAVPTTAIATASRRQSVYTLAA